MKKEHSHTIGKATFIWKGATNNSEKGNRTLYDCYNKPSQIKCFIWKTWCEWALDNNFDIWINSYNIRVFTIAGIGMYNGKKVRIYITPTRQEMYNII